MKDLAINMLFIPNLNAVQITMSTADYDTWQQDEGKLVVALSEKVVHINAVTIITLSVHWFEICKKYYRWMDNTNVAHLVELASAKSYVAQFDPTG